MFKVILYSMVSKRDLNIIIMDKIKHNWIYNSFFEQVLLYI